MTDAKTLKAQIQLEEFNSYHRLFDKIHAGGAITPTEMAIIQRPDLKSILIDLIIQRQIGRMK